MVPWAHPSLHPKWHLDRFSCFCTAHRSVSLLCNEPLRSPQKIASSFGASSPPSNTRYLGLTRVIILKSISIDLAVFGMGPKCYAVLQRTVNEEEKPQNCPFPLGFCHPTGGGPSHSIRQHAQKNLVKIACVISSRTDRTQTDRHTQMYSLQYFATAPAGEVISKTEIRRQRALWTHLLIQTLNQVANIPPRLLEEPILFLQTWRLASQLCNGFTTHFSTRAQVVTVVGVDTMDRNHLWQSAVSINSVTVMNRSLSAHQ